jgi:hypothetical protein
MEELININITISGEATRHQSNHTHGSDQGEMPSQNQDEDEARSPAYTE